MKEKKKLTFHILFVLLILAAGWYVSDIMSYRTSGTIPEREMRIIRHTAALLIEIGIFRVVAYGNSLLCISNIWLYFYDLGLSALLSRILESILSKRSMVLYKIAGRSFDFFDICIGICCISMIFWAAIAMIKWYPYKKMRTKGMTGKEKLCWEWKVSWQILKAVVIPLDELEHDLEKIG